MNQYQLQVLANQLRVAAIPMRGVKSIAVLALIKAGTRFEAPKTNGISHFLEHLVFKGTKKYPTALALSSAVDAVGAVFNAFTAKDHTGFYVKAAADQLELALDIVSQLVFKSLLPSKALEVERGVILEEIRMYEDQPMAKIKRDFESLLYSNTPLGWATIGKPANIKSLSKKAFVDYQNKFYNPKRIVVGVAGAEKIVKSQKAKVMLEQYFGQSPEGFSETIVEEKFNFHQEKPTLKITQKKVEQAHLCLGVRTYPRGDKRRYALAAMAGLLGGGMSSRLFTEIREKRGLAYYVSAGVQAYTDNGYLVMQAGTESKNVAGVVKLTLEEFIKIKEGQFKNQELAKAKEYLKGHFILSLEDSQSVADLYAENLLLEEEVRKPEEIIREINKVTKKEVQVVAKEVFVDKGLNLALISPKIETGKLEKALKFC